MTQYLAYLVDRAMEDPRLNGMQPVVEKELLHYDILFALEQGGFLEGLVFQGGTALRLCHGAPRFSEDIDFSGGADFTSSRLAALGDHLTDYLSGRYGLETIVRPPVELRDTPDASKPVTNRWRISVVTRPAQPDIPRQRIHLEICNVPSYTSEPMPMRRNYDFLPDGYENMMIRVETKDEILADKLVAFPAVLPRYTRWRDIWDMRWLGRQGATVNADMVRAKIGDYRVDDFTDLLETAIGRIPKLVGSEGFVDQMGRFLTEPVIESTVRQQAWRDVVVRELREMLTGLRRQLARRRDRSPPDGGQGAPETARSAVATTTGKMDDTGDDFDNPFAIPDPFRPPKPPWER